MSIQLKSACIPRILVYTVGAHAGVHSVYTVHTARAQVLKIETTQAAVGLSPGYTAMQQPDACVLYSMYKATQWALNDS